MVKFTIQLKGEKGLRNYIDGVTRRAQPLTMSAAQRYTESVAKRARQLSKGPWSRGGPDSISNSINVLRVGNKLVKLTVTSAHARLQEEGIGAGFITRGDQRKMPLKGKGGMAQEFAYRVRRFRPKRFLSRAIAENEKLIDDLLSRAGDKILGGK